MPPRRLFREQTTHRGYVSRFACGHTRALPARHSGGDLQSVRGLRCLAGYLGLLLSGLTPGFCFGVHRRPRWTFVGAERVEQANRVLAAVASKVAVVAVDHRQAGAHVERAKVEMLARTTKVAKVWRRS